MPYIPDNLAPIAQPARRWRQVVGEDCFGPPDLTDGRIQEARRFYRRWLLTRGDPARLRDLSSRFPSLHAAYEIWRRRSLVRYLIEALVVGRAAPASIAEALGVNEEIVGWFEYLFFDVRRWCGSPSWVPLVLVPEVHEREYLNEADVTWKILCRSVGPQALLDKIAGTQPSPENREAIHAHIRSCLIYKAERAAFAIDGMQALKKHVRRGRAGRDGAADTQESQDQKLMARLLKVVASQQDKMPVAEGKAPVPASDVAALRPAGSPPGATEGCETPRPAPPPHDSGLDPGDGR